MKGEIMFDVTATICLDDTIGDKIGNIHSGFDDREAISDVAVKVFKTINNEIEPKIDEITKKVQERIQEMNIDTDTLPEVNYPVSGELSDELLIFLNSRIEATLTEYWKRDLHTLLEHTLQLMLKGGALKDMVEDGDLPDIYEKWEADTLKSEEEVMLPMRIDDYESTADQLITLIKDEDKVIEMLVNDINIQALVHLFETQGEDVVIQAARDGQEVPETFINENNEEIKIVK